MDNANGGRILANQQAGGTTLTTESCIAACTAAGYSIAGTEYSTQCFCGNNIIEGGALANQDTDCAMTCGGNSSEICGGPNRMSIWSNQTVTVLQPPSAQTANLPGSWSYAGCITEGIDAAGNYVRLFKYQQILPTNNSANTCLTSCSEFGYMYGGMEYGDECYCGDLDDISNGNSTYVADSQCTMPCSGNATAICGAGNRISLYKWTGTPLYTWNYPNGNAAGAYQFLIGGVTIPLITSLGVNGKVTFLEKHGTGPNGTGAYELDPAQINNFNAAWRTMNGLKTDVFCSAGLTLPDRAGRQINIGGWSGTSTYGVRLYWPDGLPGQASVNDWQENYQEVSLQVGRWYPTAMLLANGSILVVGGEDGSNGAPVPSLEILPATGQTPLFMDWLKRTDPYNLYPFLVVLPSGGVFVAYYNEARILDERTFATVKTLPMIPGSVNRPDSGRTYPLEGTGVIMPQHAPYTDPLTIMICGGSNPGAAVALDNCVSTQPEAASPQWVLERMPSQRVMSCMTALPDGTYLILNGAHQGTAGFGLATSPNYNAVLYDPSKPVGARMSVMANTTVARLYHSEAILLQDGRVLVSGSDPEDNLHPQEYRVEVFLPPYLTSGAPRPSFTLVNRDWAYGAQIALTVSMPSSGTGPSRIALMGAESSTHGNSMGQRTLFPAFACAANSCTLTAPPNAHVCPPGWFQVFVLDGPTPSSSHWVRIGGDPANLGNWPNFPDFTLPGVGAVNRTLA